MSFIFFLVLYFKSIKYYNKNSSDNKVWCDMKHDLILRKRNNINIILTLIGIFSLIFSIFLVCYDYYLEQNAINMNATIKVLDYANGGYSATVFYKVEGKEYEAVVPLTKEEESLTVGDEVLIKFDMNNPNKLVKNDHLLIVAIGLGISIILLILSLGKTLKFIRNNINVKKLFKKGYIIEASVNEVIVDNKGKKVKGLYPYKLRARYLNPADNKEYIFDSFDTYIDLNETIRNNGKNTVVVAIDKENFQNYYVDIDSLFKQIKLVDPRDLMKSSKEEVKEEINENNEEADKKVSGE